MQEVLHENGSTNAPNKSADNEDDENDLYRGEPEIIKSTSQFLQTTTQQHAFLQRHKFCAGNLKFLADSYKTAHQEPYFSDLRKDG